MINMFDWMESSPSRAKSYPPRFFPPEAVDRFKEDIASMRKHYETNIEFVYEEEGKFCVDERLKSLGLSSNRKVGDLEKMIGLLTDPLHTELAQALLLRYTNESFTTPEKWTNWYKKNHVDLFFSDSGGYKFHVMPEPEVEPDSFKK